MQHVGMYLEVIILLMVVSRSDAGQVDIQRRYISPSGSVPLQITSSLNNRDVFVDVVVLIDYSVYQWFYVKTDQTKPSLKKQETVKSIQQTFDTLIDTVDEIFKTASPRFHINIAGYFIEDSGPGDWLLNVSDGNSFQLDGRLLLDSAWNWTRTMSGFPENDHIVVVTARDLYTTEQSEYINIAGIAYDGTLCNPRGYSMSLLEYRDQLNDDAVAVAHEIGHSFGSRHDGESNQCSSSDHYIMSFHHITGYTPSEYSSSVFSPCSTLYFNDHIDYITAYRDTKSLSCLFEPIKPSVSYLLPLKPGVKYDVHKQCQMIYGFRSYFCSMNTGPPETVCKRMACYNPRLGRCAHHHAADGTPCGNKKWCVGKQCIFSADAPQKNAECVYGNRPGAIYQGKDCDALMTGKAHMCYSQQNWRLCCDTCLRLAKGPPGCDYGDNLWRISACTRNKCRTAGRQYAQLCCQTCAPPSTAATITKALPPMTPRPKPITIQTTMAATTKRSITTTALLPTTTSTTSTTLSTATTAAPTPLPVALSTTLDDTIRTSSLLSETVPPDTVTSYTSLDDTTSVATSKYIATIKLNTVDNGANTGSKVLIQQTTSSDFDGNDYVNWGYISERRTLSPLENTTIYSDQRRTHQLQASGHCADNVTLQSEMNTFCSNISDSIPISRCYDVDFNRACCSTCDMYSTRIPDCEFGDHDAAACAAIDRMTCCDYKSTCCGTCREDSEPLMCFYSRGSPRKLHELYIGCLVLIVFML